MAGDERDRIIRLLISRGARAEELTGSDMELFEAGMDVLYRPETPTLTIDEVASRCGVAPDEVMALWRAFGLPTPEPGAVDYGEADVRLITRMHDVGALFGPDASLSMARVAGASMARLADAGTSSFVTTQAVPFVDGEVPYAALEVNVLVADSLESFMDALETLFRRHLLAVRRTVESVEEFGPETQDLVVVFADLVDSTRMADDLGLRRLSAAIDRFEATATDIIVGHGGRVAKFIGDEVMYVHADAGAAIEAGRALLAADADLPPMRIGVDGGQVLTRDGDFFGPVVNVAARATSLATEGTILVTDRVVDRLGGHIDSTPCGSLDVRGHGEVSFSEIRPDQ
ncbi:MAG: adenylate/guanylate cyclase domain-containing protein [Acidimicrobiales bacterium]